MDKNQPDFHDHHIDHKSEDKTNENYKDKEPNPDVPKPEVENPDADRESHNEKIVDENRSSFSGNNNFNKYF